MKLLQLPQEQESNNEFIDSLGCRGTQCKKWIESSKQRNCRKTEAFSTEGRQRAK